jgi:chitin synthase
MVIFWAVIMVYLMFAAVFISVKSVQAELAKNDNKLLLSSILQNKLFINLLVSLASTYVLYFVASFMFFEPWHMFTSFIQYLLLSPSYVNVLNVYAFCNTHDVTWGTKGDDKREELPSVSEQNGKVDVNVPTDDNDLDAQYESELKVLQTKPPVVEKKPDADEVQQDYYKGIRSAVVLVWIFCNFALSAAVLNSGGLDRIRVDSDEKRNAEVYLAIILWSVAGLSAFRFLGSTWFLIIRLVSLSLLYASSLLTNVIVPWCLDARFLTWCISLCLLYSSKISLLSDSNRSPKCLESQGILCRVV